MSKSNHTEAQIIGAIKQVEAGRKADEVAREMGVSKAGRRNSRRRGRMSNRSAPRFR
jgi:predicted transcriptional regulator